MPGHRKRTENHHWHYPNQSIKTMDKKITCEPGDHKGKEVIFIRFTYDEARNKEIRKLTGAKWSRTHKAWYVPDHNVYRERFGIEAKKPNVTPAHIHTNNRAALVRFTETLHLKAYSPNTIKTYRNEFIPLLQLLGSHNVRDLTSEKLRSYFL